MTLKTPTKIRRVLSETYARVDSSGWNSHGASSFWDLKDPIWVRSNVWRWSLWAAVVHSSYSLNIVVSWLRFGQYLGFCLPKKYPLDVAGWDETRCFFLQCRSASVDVRIWLFWANFNHTRSRGICLFRTAIPKAIKVIPWQLVVEGVVLIHSGFISGTTRGGNIYFRLLHAMNSFEPEVPPESFALPQTRQCGQATFAWREFGAKLTISL